MANHFGPDSVIVCHSYSELSSAMVKHELLNNYKKRSKRLVRLSKSKYCLDAVRKSFELLVDTVQVPTIVIKGDQKGEL